MASDESLIPCDRCDKFVSFSEYEKHIQSHATDDPNMLYNDGNMYSSQPAVGPLPRPPGYKDPNPNSVITNDDYTVNSAEVVYDYGDGDMYGGSKSNDDMKSNNNHNNNDNNNNNQMSMDDEKKNEIQDITEEAANSIRDNGCVVIKNAVRNDLSKTALRIINNALSEGPNCLSKAEYTENYDILDLWNESAAFSLSQNVLGLSNVVIPTTSSIHLVFPEKPSNDEEEEASSEAMEWTVDGLGGDQLAPFTLGMRVILSKQKFRFFKGTHLAIFGMLQKEGMDTFMKSNKVMEERASWNEETNPLVEWEVDRGDIILYHPFVCTPAIAKNATENIDYFVNFKILHKKFSTEIARRRAQHLWLGYEKLVYALNGEQLNI